jgi:hypothetical protein
MIMPVTDAEAATLQALLAGDFDDHQQMRDRLADSSWPGYLALIEAACYLAVKRRFGSGASREDIVEFVASARAHSDKAADSLDPNHAERLIHAVLGNGNIDDFDDKTRFATEVGVLIAVIADLRPTEAVLEEFMANARRLADRGRG